MADGAVDKNALDAAADELYGVHPSEFVEVRNGLAAQAKASGDKATAKAVAALRKPNQAAWLVNLLVREEPEQLAALLDLGVAMRKAQARLSAGDLKALSAQRQKLVRALAGQAYDLAADHDEQVSRTVLNQVEDTLSAALADPDAGELVRAGRLLGPLTYSGFGPAGLSLVPSPVAVEDDRATGEPDESAAQKARRRAQVEHARKVQEATAAVTVAHRALVKAERATDTLTKAQDKARAAAEQAQALVADLAAKLEAAQRSARAATDKLHGAAEALTRNTDELAAARAAVQSTEAALSVLEQGGPD